MNNGASTSKRRNGRSRAVPNQKVEEFLPFDDSMTSSSPITMTESRSLILREIDQLKKQLPASPALLEQQDRPKIVRMCASYLKLREYFSKKLIGSEGKGGGAKIEMTSLTLQAIDYFCFMLDENGKIMYITETVSTHLGYSQFQMFGSSICEYLHPEDTHLLYYIMKQRPPIQPVDCHTPVELCMLIPMRFRSKIPKRNAGFIQNGMKTMIVELFFRYSLLLDGSVICSSVQATGSMIDWAGYPEIPLSTNQFILRMSPDLKIAFADMDCYKHLRYTAFDLLDKSLYSYIHPMDLECVHKCHTSVTRECEFQSVTPLVRVLCAGGGSVHSTLHFAKILVNGGRLPYYIAVIITVVGRIESGVEDVLQMAPVKKQEKSNGLGAHSSAFYAQAVAPSSKQKPAVKRKLPEARNTKEPTENTRGRGFMKREVNPRNESNISAMAAEVEHLLVCPTPQPPFFIPIHFDPPAYQPINPYLYDPMHHYL